MNRRKLGNPTRRRRFENLNGNEVLKWKFKKHVARVWAGYIWFRLEFSGGLL
jgi:hypothetical protein